MIDGRLVRGDRTKRAVLDTAVAQASVDGLDGMSLSSLARSLGVSKSGLFAHWPDKEQLQLAVIRHASDMWTDEIVRPALAEPTALQRLWALHDRRLAFYAARTLPGGCFFAAVEPEFDDHHGPVRDAIAQAIADWTTVLQVAVRKALERGELKPETDPEQLVFEIQALGKAAVTHMSLFNDPATYGFARRGVLDRLRALATDPSLLPEE